MAIKLRGVGLPAARFSLRPFMARLVVGVVMLAAATAAWSQTAFPFTVLYKFPGPDFQQYALGNLVLDSSGAIYGVDNGGPPAYPNCPCGVVFKLKRGTFTNLYEFDETAPDPLNPSSGLVRDTAGNLYGETLSGGPLGFGSVYTIDPNGDETVLASFPLEEESPLGGLVQDKTGDLLGVSPTRTGGGEIFKVDLQGIKTVLYTFPADGKSGSHPASALVVDKAGNIYGTTAGGGKYISPLNQNQGFGVLFKLSPDGTETVLHNFNGKGEGGGPRGLTQDEQGNLIGYAQYGASSGPEYLCTLFGGCGTIFKYDTQGKFSIVHTFTGGTADGATPVGAPLLLNGSIYGATQNGGSYTKICQQGCGAVFRFDPASEVLTKLHTFVHTDGANPSTGLVTDGNGNLFGATLSGHIYRVTLPQ